MRAVDLSPRDARGRVGGPEGEAWPAYLVLGLLALGLVFALLFVQASNDRSSQKARLDRLRAQQTVLQQQTDALKPFADLAALRASALGTVTQLASSRFRVPSLLHSISRRIPPNVTLSTFDATLAVAAGATVAPTTGTPTGPTVQLTGCSTSHTAVAGMLDQMQAVRGVTSVTLGNSSKTEVGTGAAGAPATTTGGCPHSTQFSMALALTPPPGAVAAPAAPGTVPAPVAAAPAPTTQAATTTPTTTPPPAP